MFKLRQTWNDVFPQKKLYAIDVQINFLDPAWPVTAKPPPNSIHFNPKFLKTTATTTKTKIETEPTQILTSSTVPGNIDKETLLMQEKLIQKQKELLELQQKKLELEVLQTQNATAIMQQRPQSNLGNGPRINPVNSALISASRPIRDPRLLRQQHKTNNTNSNVQLGQKTAMLENNKIVTNKMGVRKIRNDPRLVNKDDNILSQKIDTNKSSNLNKSRISEIVQKSHKTSSRASPRGSIESDSTKSSSSSSLDSPSKNKSDKSSKSPIRHKKKDKSDVKKNSPKNQKRDKLYKSDSPITTFKGVKSSTKNRNYVRRNLGAMSPEPPQDEDLRSFGPPEKQPRLQGDSSDEQIFEDLLLTPHNGKSIVVIPPDVDFQTKDDEIDEVVIVVSYLTKEVLGEIELHYERVLVIGSNVVSTTKGMDVDLRQLPAAVIGKKRPSTEAPDQSSAKKSKTKVFDKLFGDEDTDLRQLPVNTERPPTPPPPIISSTDNTVDKIQSTKSNLEAVRAKLANATNRDKIMSKSFNKKRMNIVEDLDLRVPKVSSTTDIPNKIIISPEDESCIKSGTLTKEQEAQLLNKIIMQMEKNKLKEAKKKDHEECFNISLQPISDDELIDSDEEKNDADDDRLSDNNVVTETVVLNDNNLVPFNDKDERVHPNSSTSMEPTQLLEEYATKFPPQRDFVPLPHPLQEEEMPGSPDISENQLTNGAVNQDEIKTINIDGVPKDIRFYDETAITFINWDDPREISFQDGVRHVIFNDVDSFLLGFNKPYQEILINGLLHRVRLGAPSREIFIDQVPYECYFGSAGIRIDLNGVNTTVQLEGPPPQVKIVLPKGIKPGHVVIKDMEGQGSFSPRFDENSQDSMPVDTNEPALPAIGKLKLSKGSDSPERNSNSPNFFQNLLQQQSINNLDVLSNVMTPSVHSIPATGGYQIENISPNEGNQSTNIPQLTVPAVAPTLNINDLFQKLVASGFVTSGNEQKPSVPLPIPVHKKEKYDTELQKALETTNNSNQIVPTKPLKRNPYENLKLITFAKPETLKVRQGALYTALYAGMQCSSCGMRFSPEASLQYSQHLDWHFRQNRKGKRNIRVATSRRWYYSLSDWKNYEELEDLEEREKNYFDQQQQADNAGDEAEEEIEIPSVPADPETTDECCNVCHDKFDQFFHEEKEEWHLRNAIRVDENTYHPVCYEDYQQSLIEQTLEESKIEASIEEEESRDSAIPGLEIIIDDDDDSQPNDSVEPAEVVSLESDESKPQTEETKEESQEPPEEDDDVILNEIAPIKIIVDDDDDDNQEFVPNVNQSVKIKEEKLDDGFVEVAGLVSLQNGGQIKIKAEPIDLDEATRREQMREERQSSVLEQDAQKHPEQESTTFSTPTHPELVTSIDGNIEIVCSAASTIPTGGVTGNKIKINISKPLPVITAKEKDTSSDSDFPTDTYIDPSEPFPPGEEPEPIKLKPVLEGIKLKKLPPIKKGTELTGLCSIM
ncbi:hypothetical protein NQ314_020418 [Rhamnusium bicolor]|uniref:Pre-mRNA cleavage complex 2 protein Pcf11 helical domain-containing protein n=1 Tax=Rhamnusium bicolor TaxID=1586634 RepID=A0AAV8WK57_9CUCU|nr:hypothetical protein NQ314_020418 [Rhamnusium bicolor]